MSSPKLRVNFRPKSEIQTFFPPKIRWSPKKKKKKKVFTAIETDFSAEIVRFRLVGGMHPEMETDFSKWRLIFRPKSLVLGWWGGCIPPIPPLNPPLTALRMGCEPTKTALRLWRMHGDCAANHIRYNGNDVVDCFVINFILRKNEWWKGNGKINNSLNVSY